MDRFSIPEMPPGCIPLLESLRSSLFPGWQQLLLPAGLQPGLLPTTTTTAQVVAALPPGLSPLSIAAITGVVPTSVASEQPSSSYTQSPKTPPLNNNLKKDERAGSDGEDEEMDKKSDRTNLATECTTPSTASLSSPTRLTFDMFHGASTSDERRQSLGNISDKSVDARSEKRVTCDLCAKSYCDKGALKIHMSAVHLKQMQMCTVPGCTKEFTSRRSRNRHSKNKNMKLHTLDPAKLAAKQEQSRILAESMLAQSFPVRESRKRKLTEGALDLSMQAESLTTPTPLLPILSAPNMLLLQQMMNSQLFAQQPAAPLVAAVTVGNTIPSTTVSPNRHTELGDDTKINYLSS